MKTLVIYHSADFDGIFCREIARKFLPEATLVGWDYGQPAINGVGYDTIYVLDLSPDCVTPMVEWEKMVWIDHHKSAIYKFPPKLCGYRIDGVAACRLAWQYFTCEFGPNNPNCHPADYRLPEKQEYIDRAISEPLAVRLAGEYDIWDKRDPNSELFQHGLKSREISDGWWTEMLVEITGNGCVQSLLDAGRVIQYVKTQENESIIKAAGFTVQFEGLTFLACNHARYNSFLFTAGLKPEHDACFGFAWRDGHWNVSLYHAPGKEHHDLSLIAVKHGGGGHRGACGFRSKTLPFLL